MNRIILDYLLKNFLKTFVIFILVFYSFGMVLNLFEEVEFFKDANVSIFIPLILTGIYVPSLIIKLLPFIILSIDFYKWYGIDLIIKPLKSWETYLECVGN